MRLGDRAKEVPFGDEELFVLCSSTLVVKGVSFVWHRYRLKLKLNKGVVNE